MSLFGSIFAKLQSDGTVTGYVGDRIFNGLGIVAGTQLQVTVDQNGEDNVKAIPYTMYDVTIRALADTPEDRDGLAKATKAALDRQTWTNSQATVCSVLFTDELTVNVSIEGNAEKVFYGKDLDFRFCAKEA